MKAERIFETVLYADDLESIEQFYAGVLGLEVLNRSETVVAFRCENSVLLIFDPEQSAAPGRDVPSHGSLGPGHIAFAARDEVLDDWRIRLADEGVDIEMEVEWGSGGISLYFRDPAGNSVELAPPSLWGGGWKF